MAEKTKKVPMRMCVACRQVKEKREMMRIVRSPEGNISLDKTGKSAGRGAYICRDEECFNKLRKQKILNKVFSQMIEDNVYDSIESEFNDKK